MNTSHLLDHKFMNNLFPFYILLDKNLKIIKGGDSVIQLYPLKENENFLDFFRIERPINFDISSEKIREFSDHLFVLKALDYNIGMRGQMYCDKDYIAFLGTPLIQTLTDLDKYELNMKNFAIHDSITQFLFSLQMHVSSLADTKKLAEKLKKSNQDLKNSNAAMDEFMYRLTHDLRAPAINITNMSGMLKKIDPFDEGSKAEMVFSLLSTSGDKLLQTIDDFLLVSKVEKSEANPPEHISLREIFSEIEESLASIIEAEKTTISYKLKYDEMYISLEDIRSILQNLIHNSIKYSKEAPIINITSWKENNKLWIKVKDYGMGIDLERYRHKLFKMFSRLHPQAKVEGTGIGLYLVKQLVERNGGKIDVESKPNEGTTFTLSFDIVSH